MDIPREFLLFLVMFCIISIGMGIVTIYGVEKRFDGLIISEGNNVLDLPLFLTSKEGRDYMASYINNYIKPNTNMYKLDESHIQFIKTNFKPTDKTLSNNESPNYNFVLSILGYKKK